MEQGPAGDFELARLRDWAWQRGRTDVIGRLDLYAATATFQQSPQWINAVRLAALLPADAPGAPAAQLRQMAAGGVSDGARAAVAPAMSSWLAAQRDRLRADLTEMAAGNAGRARLPRA